ncbi:hypothetical protein D1007_06777 [Hordeum vulgare]|nr:hypothetical protein D1007_06777 [Hordeum vulgare]
MVVSPPTEIQDEESPNIGSGSGVANEVIDLEGNDQDVGVDELVGKKLKKTKSKCWDHFDKFFKTVVVDGNKVMEAWAKCKYRTYDGNRNNKNGTTIFLSHIRMHIVKLGRNLIKLEKKEHGFVAIKMYRTCASNYSHSTDVPSSTNTSQEGETGFMVEDEDDYFLSQQGTHGFNEGYTDLDKYMAEVTLSFSKVGFD